MSKISIFNNVLEPYNPVHEDLIDYLEKTRDGEWQDIVIKCRTIRNKEERDAFKRTMPTATLSGQFSYRSDDKLIQHSGYISMDLDDVENLVQVKRTLEKDRYVYACFMSTSGTGLRVIFRIDTHKHRESFIGIRQYLYNMYEITSVDANGINVSKPYVVSFDPYTYINPDDTQIFKKYIKETPIKPLADFVHNDGDFKEIIEQIKGRSLDICADYNDWIRCGFAIADKFGADGLEYFRAISQSEQKRIKVEQQYRYCLKAKGSQKVNIATIYYLAKAHGVKIVSEQTKKIVRTTKNGKKAGLKKEQILANLLKFDSITGAEELVDQVFDKGSDLEDEEESILHGLEMFISNNYSLRMNEVTGYLEREGKSQTNSDLNTIFIAAKKILPKLDYQLMMRLLKSDFIESYNPFFEFLGSDGIAVQLPAMPLEVQPIYESPLINKLSSCIKNDNPAYTLHFTRKWIVSIISSMHKVHSPLLHCLLGPPETGKTEFYRRLLPPQLKRYYAESKLDKGTDDELLMCENILIMDDELSGKSKRDTDKLKNITSKQYFSLRRPYGDHNENILRLSVLCGTSNNLKVMGYDPTPNRRIIPIIVDDIDRERYNSIDKRELFMEAFRVYKLGFDWRITRDDMPYLNTDNEKFEHIVKERELILKYYRIGGDQVPIDERMSTTEILVELEILTRQRLSMQTLGRELDNLGFIKITTRINAVQTVKKWCVIKNFVPIQNRLNDNQNYF